MSTELTPAARRERALDNARTMLGIDGRWKNYAEPNLLAADVIALLGADTAWPATPRIPTRAEIDVHAARHGRCWGWSAEDAPPEGLWQYRRGPGTPPTMGALAVVGVGVLRLYDPGSDEHLATPEADGVDEMRPCDADGTPVPWPVVAPVGAP